jgi:hypothetical protein
VTLEVFELEMLGGAMEKRYRTMRPEIEDMPWGTIDPSKYPEPLRLAAQRAWTGAAFQEHRTGAACAATLRSLIEARAPLDLIAVACRFPLDEMVHVELCSRLAMEFGGGIELHHDPETMVAPVGVGEEALMRAAHQVVCFFCVGEALSIPLLHGTATRATHPLTRAVLRRIVQDEADHGTFGWAFLDWAQPHLEPEDLVALGQTADYAIQSVYANWDAIRARPPASDAHIGDLGWMQTDEYLALAERSLAKQVVKPLRARGIPIHSAH